MLRAAPSLDFPLSLDNLLCCSIFIVKKRFLLCNFPYFSLCPFPLFLSQCTTEKNASAFFTPHIRHLQTLVRFSKDFSRMNSPPSSLNLSSHVNPPVHHLCGHLLDSLQNVHACHVLGSPEWDTTTHCQAQEKDHLPHPAGRVLLSAEHFTGCLSSPYFKLLSIRIF